MTGLEHHVSNSRKWPTFNLPLRDIITVIHWNPSGFDMPVDPLISHFYKVTVLVNLMKYLDNATLRTVLRNFVSFRVCIPQSIVERVMHEQFGCQWESYYKAYTAHYSSCINPEDRLNLSKDCELKRNRSAGGEGSLGSPRFLWNSH
jgi:hypothetical protein